MKNYFLGIGIDRYKNGYIHQLKSAVRDVEKIQQALIEYYLFDSSNSILLLNKMATKESIIKQVDQYYLIKEKFNLVIYFAGHGKLDKEHQPEEGYILPYDAHDSETESYINQRDLLGRLEKINNCHHLLLLWDSCFSGSLFDVATRQRSNEEQLVAYPSRWAITSGSRGEEVEDGTGLKHSPFADALKRTLHIQLDMIPASHLAKELQSFMVRNNHNPPLLAPLLMKGHEWGEFAFEMNSRYVEQTISTTILIPPVADPIVFFGRVEELHEIRQRLTRLSKGGHILLLHAEGGMGKTSLASKYWHNYQRAYKNMAWLNCQNGIYSDALPRLAMALGIEMDLGTDYLPLLKKQLLTINDRFLLVMDNVDDATEISSFQLEFGKLNLQILMTSRCQNVLVEKTQEMLLGSLPKHLARKLFREFYSKESGADFENLLDRFLDAIGSHTLLIEVFAKNLNETATLSPTPLTMETFLAKLEESGLYLESDSFSMRTHYTGNVEKSAANTDDILNILYDFSKLSEDERYTLVNLALLPTESYDLEFLMELFQSDNDAKYEAALNLLNMKGWIGGTGPYYRISPVIQKLIITKNKESLWDDSSVLVKNVSKKLENEIKLSNYLTPQKVLNIGKNIERSVEIPDDPLSRNFFYNLFSAIRKLSSGKEWTLYSEKLINKIINSS